MKMKKTIILFAAFSFVFGACTKENVSCVTEQKADQITLTFSADMEVPEELKTSFDTSTLEMKWADNDSVTVYYRLKSDNSTQKAIAKITTNSGTTAKFSVTIDSDAKLDTLFAVYAPNYNNSPFEHRESGGKPTKYSSQRIKIPLVQTANANGLGKPFSMIGRWTSNDGGEPHFDFKNTVALLKININNNSLYSSIDSLVLSTSKRFGETYYWGWYGDNLEYYSASRNYLSWCLKGPFTGNGTYYLGIPRNDNYREYTELKVTLYAGGEARVTKTYTNSNSITVDCSKVYHFGTFNLDYKTFPVPLGKSWYSTTWTKFNTYITSIGGSINFTSADFNGLKLTSLASTSGRPSFDTGNQQIRGRLAAEFVADAATNARLVVYGVFKSNTCIYLNDTTSTPVATFEKVQTGETKDSVYVDFPEVAKGDRIFIKHTSNTTGDSESKFKTIKWISKPAE